MVLKKIVRKLILSLTTAITISITSQAESCKYAFPFSNNRVQELAPGDVSVVWKLRTGLGSCGFENEKIEGKKFVVTLMNLFEEVIRQDTVMVPVFHFVLHKDDALIVNIREIGTHYENQLVVSPRRRPMPRNDSRVDSLNFALGNGFFFNAVSLLYKMHRPDLADKVVEQHELLFPADYRRSREIFNSYFDPVSNGLIQMPYVVARNFLKSLRRLEIVPKVKRFEIHAAIGENDSIESISTFPSVNNAALRETLNLLKIDRHNVSHAKLILVVDTRKWKLTNARAITDPSSKAFKLWHRPVSPGPVHR
jgi:hypothetical protein